MSHWFQTTAQSLGSRILYVALLGGGAIFTAGCGKHIGDSCTLSTDCSVQGDRQCDTAQPGGYCTLFGCQGNLCPDKAACVLFQPSIPGCAYTDREPARTAQSICMKNCDTSADCRENEGYVCAKPSDPPWGALILDDNQGVKICMPADPAKVSSTDGTDPRDEDNDAAVCSPNTPDASFSPADAGPMTPVDAGFDGGFDAGVDAGGDAGADAGDGG